MFRSDNFDEIRKKEDGFTQVIPISTCITQDEEAFSKANKCRQNTTRVGNLWQNEVDRYGVREPASHNDQLARAINHRCRQDTRAKHLTQHLNMTNFVVVGLACGEPVAQCINYAPGTVKTQILSFFSRTCSKT